MGRALAAGVVYFAIVFAAGFVLGALRVLVVVPRLGEMAAVLLELPVMLGISWLVCRGLIARFRVAAASGPRIAMGVFGFLLMMAGELGVSVFALGRTIAEHFSAQRTFTADLGLAAQVAPGTRYAKLAGAFQQEYLKATTSTIVGGTAEMQRNLIAQHGLGERRHRAEHVADRHHDE